MEIGILAYGAYIPRRRLARKSVADANAWFNPALRGQAKAERSMCNWDEDAVTMAVEAARDCLTGFARDQVRSVQLASTSFPFEDRLNSGIVAQALNLGAEISSLDVGSSQRAATAGLAAVLEGAAGAGGPALFLASEKRRTKVGSTLEMTSGDGAAALLVGSGKVIAKFIGSNSRTVDFIDHYRGQGVAYDYVWEERWIRDEGYNKIVPATLAGLFKKTGVEPGSIAHFCMPCTLGKVAASVAKKAGIPESAVRDNLSAVCGETGTAHSLVMLADALAAAKPGERILVVGFGQGCDALLFEATADLQRLPPRLGVRGYLARRREETNYNRFLAFNELVTLERGMRAELDKQTALSTLYRKRDMILGLVGGRCSKCGTLQFPKSNVCVAPECNAFHTQTDHPFADTIGQINSHTADQLTYSPDPPTFFGMVQFDAGGRLMTDFTDVDMADVKVGQKVRMVFRIKDYDSQRGFTRYFWKAT
ncbi:MAG: hydroxymethylglutaryl-CoA synthase family protein, partial [Betaproteobacteria bacterium]